MKRFAVTAILLLLCVACPTSMEASGKKLTIDMSNIKTIFVGWVNLDPDEYRLLDYDSKGDWVKVIDEVNDNFQNDLKTNYLAGRSLTMAKNKDDVSADGKDLYIKFTDVTEDKGYRLHIAVHFIDPKTNTELAVIPEDRYGAHVCGLEGCIEKELDKVGELMKNQLSAK